MSTATRSMRHWIGEPGLDWMKVSAVAMSLLPFTGVIDSSGCPKPLPLHLIVDNYGTHTQVKVRDWLAKHPRFHVHLTPTSSSWLNLVERWFRELTEKRIRRGSFQSVPELIAAIEDYLEASNADSKPFVWHASIQAILDKIAHSKAVYETIH